MNKFIGFISELITLVVEKISYGVSVVVEFLMDLMS